VTALRREGKTFILDLWVRHPTSAAAAAAAAAATKDALNGCSLRGTKEAAVDVLLGELPQRVDVLLGGLPRRGFSGRV
jgi:hypothetical protein